jgi:hypothetical protein
MDGAMLSATAALGGSLIGALTSFATTWLAQTHQRRVQLEFQEITRRERLFGDFIMQASELYADALTHNRLDARKLVPLYAVKAQVSLFASPSTIERADEVLRLIIDTYYGPNLDLSSRESVLNGGHDFLHAFTEACRSDLKV